MQIVQQILFILISAVSVWFFTRKVKEIARNIKLGRDEDISDNPTKRWKNVLLLAFGQKKMFRNPLVAVMHFFALAGVPKKHHAVFALAGVPKKHHAVAVCCVRA